MREAEPATSDLLVRGAVVIHGLVLLETLARSLSSEASLLGSDWLAEYLVRTANVGILVGPMLVLALLWVRIPGRFVARAQALGTWSLRALCRPAAVLRLGVIYVLSLVSLALSVCQSYDLAWHTAAAFAWVVLVPASAVELLLATRRPLPPSPPHPLGRVVWASGAAGLGVLVCPLLLTAQWTAAAALPLLFLLAPSPGSWNRLVTRILIGVTTLGVLGGLCIDLDRPTLRRLRSVHAAYSDLGSALLRWATDFDRDGSSGMFGLDCDDLDPERSPTLRDVPGDGIDQNCTGADASGAEARARLRPGGSRAPAPPSYEPGWTPDIFLVTVDALRWDALTNGDGAPSMPETARWAEGCIRFEHARTNATFTNLALIALHTGLLPQHVMKGMEALIAVGRSGDGTVRTIPPTLATVLLGHGYLAKAVVPVKHYTQLVLHGFEAEHALHRPPEEVFGKARAFIERAQGHPLFLWVHLMDVHAPYPGGQDLEHYLLGLRRFDVPLAAFLRSLSEDAVVVFTADHGEAFGEHGQRFHGSTLFDEELRVPLVLCLPPARNLGPPRSVDTPVSLVDVTPTLLDLLGFDIGYPQHGESLVTHLRDGVPLRSPWVHFVAQTGWSRGEGVLSGCAKLIRDLDNEWEALFDICEDRAERVDLLETQPAEAERLRTLLNEIRDADIDAYRSWDLDTLRARNARDARDDR